MSNTTLQNKGNFKVLVGKTALSVLEDNEFTFRGYQVNELVEKSTYEETFFLMAVGRLPTLLELQNFQKSIASQRKLTSQVKHLLENTPATAHPMHIWIMLTMQMASSNPEKDEDPLTAVSRILGVLPSAMFYWYYYHLNGTRIETFTGEYDMVASHFLKLACLGKHEVAEDDEAVKIINGMLILFGDAVFSYGTYAARMASKMAADFYTSLATGIATFSGIKHGGAGQGVVDYFYNIQSVEEIEPYISKRLETRSLIYGFGHVLLKGDDPRRTKSRELCQRFLKTKYGVPKYGQYVAETYRVIGEKRPDLHDNCDFSYGAVFACFGLPSTMASCFLSLCRMIGITAHIIEQREMKEAFFIPTAVYVGDKGNKYVDMNERFKAKL